MFRDAAYDQDFPLLPAIALLSLGAAILIVFVLLACKYPLLYALTVLPWSVWRLRKTARKRTN